MKNAKNLYFKFNENIFSDTLNQSKKYHFLSLKSKNVFDYYINC